MRRAPWALLLWLGCASTPPAAPPGGPVADGPKPGIDEQDLTSLLPAAVDSVLSIDVAGVRASRFAGPLLDSLRQQQDPPAEDAADRASKLAEGRAARGFDEIADVDCFVFGRFGPPGGERATLELARGRFDRARMEAAFRQRFPQAVVTSFGGLPGLASAEVGLTFPSPRLFAFGPPWALRALAAVVESRAVSARATPWLTQARRSMPAKLRARGPATIELLLLATTGTRAELAALLEMEAPLEHLAARIELGDEARAYLVATGKTPEDAALMEQRLGETLRALRGRPSLEALGLGPVIARASVASRGTRMLLELAVTGRDRALVARKLASLGAVWARGRAAPEAPAEIPAPP